MRDRGSGQVNQRKDTRVGFAVHGWPVSIRVRLERETSSLETDGEHRHCRQMNPIFRKPPVGRSEQQITTSPHPRLSQLV